MERFSIKERLEQKLTGKPVKERKFYKIPFRSKKRAKEQKQYVEIVKEILAERPLCEMKLQGCQKVASGLHHQKKRDGNFLNRKYLIPGCNSCQLRAETHPLEAIEKSVSLSKFTKD